MTSSPDPLAKARRHLDQGDVPAALPLLDSLLAMDPDNTAARYELAMARRALGETTVALRHFDTLLARDPHHALAHNNRGVLLMEMGDLREAYGSFKAAAAARPGFADALANIGLVALLLQRPEEAAATLDAALDADPAHHKACLSRAQAAVALENREEALAFAEQALALAPDDEESLMLVGGLAFALQDTATAREALTRLHALTPEDPGAAANLAIVLALDGEPEAAVAACDAALQRDPGHVTALHQRGLALRSLGRLDEARGALEKAHAMAPEDPAPLLDLIMLTATTEGEDAARSLVAVNEDLLAEHPDLPALQASLAEAPNQPNPDQPT